MFCEWLLLQNAHAALGLGEDLSPQVLRYAPYLLIDKHPLHPQSRGTFLKSSERGYADAPATISFGFTSFAFSNTYRNLKLQYLPQRRNRPRYIAYH